MAHIIEKLSDHYVRKQIKLHTDSAKKVTLPNPFYKRALDFECGFGRRKRKKQRKRRGREREGREMSNVIYRNGKFLLEILNPKMPKHRPMPEIKKKKSDSSLSQISQQTLQ